MNMSLGGLNMGELCLCLRMGVYLGLKSIQMFLSVGQIPKEFGGVKLWL
jgi:hypothetical protein